MKAWVCRKVGEVEDLELTDVPEPRLAAGQVRIGIRAAALNFPDVLTVRGQYQHKPDLPFSPGMECAGEVLEVAPEVRDLAPGDRVMAHPGIGCLAQQVCVSADQVYRIPSSCSDEAAAGFIVTYGTSYHALVDRAAICHEDTVLVLGAAGGVGITAVEIAHLIGARVIAAASTDAKLALCAEYGADTLIDYTREDLKAAVMAATAEAGVDIVYDPVGGDATLQGLRCLALNGRLLVVGFASGEIARIPANRLLLRQSQSVGVAFGAYSRRFPAESRKRMNVLIDWWRGGKLRPHVSAVFALGDAVQALHMLANRQAMGKVVVRIEDS